MKIQVAGKQYCSFYGKQFFEIEPYRECSFLDESLVIHAFCKAFNYVSLMKDKGNRPLRCQDCKDQGDAVYQTWRIK